MSNQQYIIWNCTTSLHVSSKHHRIVSICIPHRVRLSLGVHVCPSGCMVIPWCAWACLVVSLDIPLCLCLSLICMLSLGVHWRAYIPCYPTFSYTVLLTVHSAKTEKDVYESGVRNFIGSTMKLKEG